MNLCVWFISLNPWTPIKLTLPLPIFFGTNMFYLSSFLYGENEKLVDDNKVLPF